MDKIEKIRQEIKRLKEENHNIRCQHNEIYCIGYDDAFNDILLFIESLQQKQKEVDWEEEDKLEREINNAGMAMTEHVPSWKEVEQFARYFYELGQNSKK